MTDRYDNIRKALEMGPTPGPFSSVRSYSPGNQELIIRLTRNDEYGITETYCTVRNRLGDTGKTEASAAFIAACDPDTIRALLAERDALVEAISAQQPAGVDEAHDPSLLRFYGVSDYPSLVAAMEEHVLKLIDTHKRNVKPWEDTFPPTLLPKWVREQGVVPTEEGLALAQKWEDEAAESWGEDDAHRAKQECCDELRGLLTAAIAAQQQGGAA